MPQVRFALLGRLVAAAALPHEQHPRDAAPAMEGAPAEERAFADRPPSRPLALSSHVSDDSDAGRSPRQQADMTLRFIPSG